MVDQETFSRRLDALDLYLERVERLGSVSEAEFAEAPAIHDLAERYLHLLMEACIDLANHWIADRALRTPESNRDTFSVLEESGEIDAALAERLRGWAGFRNILVHQYASIDHRVAYRAIQNDLQDLVALRAWAGFRNILVHQYASIDHRIAYRAIQNDLQDLVALRAWAAGKL